MCRHYRASGSSDRGNQRFLGSDGRIGIINGCVIGSISIKSNNVGRVHFEKWFDLKTD